MSMNLFWGLCSVVGLERDSSLRLERQGGRQRKDSFGACAFIPIVTANSKGTFLWGQGVSLTISYNNAPFFLMGSQKNFFITDISLLSQLLVFPSRTCCMFSKGD